MPEESRSWILLLCRVAPSQGRPERGGGPANSRQLFGGGGWPKRDDRGAARCRNETGSPLDCWIRRQSPLSVRLQGSVREGGRDLAAHGRHDRFDDEGHVGSV